MFAFLRLERFRKATMAEKNNFGKQKYENEVFCGLQYPLESHGGRFLCGFKHCGRKKVWFCLFCISICFYIFLVIIWCVVSPTDDCFKGAWTVLYPV